MAVSVHVRAAALDAVERGRLVFGGDLVVFTGVEPLRELCTLTSTKLVALVGHVDVDVAFERLGGADARAALDTVRRWYRSDTTVAQLWAAALEQVGIEVSTTGWDWRHLRFLPPEAHATGALAALGAHRDTWASNVRAQVNWWTPKVAIDRDRALAFFPRHWTQPLRNTSADWDLEAVRRAEGTGSGAAAAAGQPVVPTPIDPVDPADEVRVVIRPGDLLCFSGSHVHASVRNVSGRTRVSAEVRTVDIADVAAGRGAPNVDGAAPHVALDWFRTIVDGTPLSRDPVVLP